MEMRLGDSHFMPSSHSEALGSVPISSFSHDLCENDAAMTSASLFDDEERLHLTFFALAPGSEDRPTRRRRRVYGDANF